MKTKYDCLRESLDGIMEELINPLSDVFKDEAFKLLCRGPQSIHLTGSGLEVEITPIFDHDAFAITEFHVDIDTGRGDYEHAVTDWYSYLMGFLDACP